MFYSCSCLTTLTWGENFNTSNVTNMQGMFWFCRNLTTLTLGDKFYTSNVEDMSNMFNGCSGLTALTLGDKSDTSKVTDMSRMFYNCSALKSLDLSGFCTTEGCNTNSVFDGCSGIARITVGSGWTNIPKFPDKSWFSITDIKGYTPDDILTGTADTYAIKIDYSVEHYHENAEDDDFSKVDTDIRTGLWGELSAAEAKSYDGFTVKEPITQLAVVENTVIKIYYSRNNYSITYDMNGHGEQISPLEKKYGAVVTAPEAPAETGYTFRGWFTDKSCTEGNEFEFSTMPLEGKTVYAKWTANNYEVTFTGNYDGSAYSQTVTETYDAKYILPATDPERAGYTFIGWYTGMNGGEQITADTIVAITTAQTLYAHWSANTYAVTFTGNYEDIDYSETITQTFDSLYILPAANPKRTDYIFNGWYTEAKGGAKITSGSVVGITSDTTLYAQWKKDRSSIPFIGTWGDPVTGTWTQDANGVWHFSTTAAFRATWGYIVNPYANEGQNKADWFWFDANGNMLTGWQYINGKWYYLNPSKDGTLGACLIGPGITPDGYEVDSAGAWTGR